MSSEEDDKEIKMFESFLEILAVIALFIFFPIVFDEVFRYNENFPLAPLNVPFLLSLTMLIVLLLYLTWTGFLDRISAIAQYNLLKKKLENKKVKPVTKSENGVIVEKICYQCDEYIPIALEICPYCSFDEYKIKEEEGLIRCKSCYSFINENFFTCQLCGNSTK